MAERTATAGPGERRGDHFIPVPKRDLLAALIADPGLGEGDRAALADIGRRIALLFHVEFHRRREALADLYARFDPDHPRPPARADDARARAGFLADLEGALLTANFHPLEPGALDRARDAEGRLDTRVRVPADAFELVRFYARGRARRRFEVRRWFGLVRREVEAEAYATVAFVAVPRPAKENRQLSPGAIYLKLFRDIPVADLPSLYPNARAVMRLTDQLLIGVPAVVGGVPILMNIGPALWVLLLVIGAWLGVTGAAEGDAAKQALAALSGLGALGGFIARQWIKYERQKLKYQKQVAENAYFNNLANNAGVFGHVIGASEDAEVKEAALAWALLRRDGPRTAPDLDAAVEGSLAGRFGLTVDFEIDDALAKLRRLRLVEEEADGRLAAVPPETALARLDEAWARVTRLAFADPAL